MALDDLLADAPRDDDLDIDAIWSRVSDRLWGGDDPRR
jgi:hypothetical protein